MVTTSVVALLQLLMMMMWGFTEGAPAALLGFDTHHTGGTQQPTPSEVVALLAIPADRSSAVLKATTAPVTTDLDDTARASPMFVRRDAGADPTTSEILSGSSTAAAAPSGHDSVSATTPAGMANSSSKCGAWLGSANGETLPVSTDGRYIIRRVLAYNNAAAGVTDNMFGSLHMMFAACTSLCTF